MRSMLELMLHMYVVSMTARYELILTGFVLFVDSARVLQCDTRVGIQAHLGAVLATR